MHQPCTDGACSLCHRAGRSGVDELSGLNIGFSFVYRRVGGRIDDDIGSDASDGVCYSSKVGQVAAQHGAVAVQRNQLAQWTQAALQLPTDLPISTEQQDLQTTASGVWLYCLLVHSR